MVVPESDADGCPRAENLNSSRVNTLEQARAELAKEKASKLCPNKQIVVAGPTKP